MLHKASTNSFQPLYFFVPFDFSGYCFNCIMNNELISNDFKRKLNNIK